MSDQLEKAAALAEKITTKAEEALAKLELEMAMMRWPAEFRAIMWEAVVEVAKQRAAAAKEPRP